MHTGRCSPGGTVRNTLALPCVPAYRCMAADRQQVLEAAVFAREQGLALIPLGEGSNVVLPPRLDACVLQLEDCSVQVIAQDSTHSVLRVGAGKSWHALVLETLAMACFGLENLALIPGCVGAAPVQNIGAYGRELAEFVVAVHGADLEAMQPLSLAADQCAFAYRDSIFKHDLRDRFVITAVDLRLPREPCVNVSYPALRQRLDSDSPTPMEVCAAVTAVRCERLPDPREHPNAGSFFKNPLVRAEVAGALSRRYPELPVHPQPDGRSKLSAAWLIDHCGLRGAAHGQARVSTRHALVIETGPGATQAEVLALAATITGTVAAEFGVTLEPEPRVYA